MRTSLNLRLLLNYFGNSKEMFIKNPKSVHFHPVIAHFSISLTSKLLSAYDELRDANILALSLEGPFEIAKTPSSQKLALI